MAFLKKKFIWNFTKELNTERFKFGLKTSKIFLWAMPIIQSLVLAT